MFCPYSSILYIYIYIYTYIYIQWTLLLRRLSVSVLRYELLDDRHRWFVCTGLSLCRTNTLFLDAVRWVQQSLKHLDVLSGPDARRIRIFLTSSQQSYLKLGYLVWWHINSWWSFNAKSCLYVISKSIVCVCLRTVKLCQVFLFIVLHTEVHTISFQTFFVWALLLILHKWNSSPLRSDLFRLQCTCTVPTNSGRLHGSLLVCACQWPLSQPLSSPQLSRNDRCELRE